MTNPFDGSGIEPTDGERGGQYYGAHAPKPKSRLILGAVGSVLLVAGVVWKFVIGSADTESLGVTDFAWLILLALGGLLVAIAVRRERRVE